MKKIVFGLSAVVLAALSAGCTYREHTQAVVAAPGAEYYGDRYYTPAPAYYYPSTTAYVRYY
jgi:hypothetical protein